MTYFLELHSEKGLTGGGLGRQGVETWAFLTQPRFLYETLRIFPGRGMTLNKEPAMTHPI